MAQASADDQVLLHVALQHQMSGRLPEAEQIYRQIVKQFPKQAEAVYRLAMLQIQTGRVQAGAELLKKSISLRPKSTDSHFNLGNAYSQLGQFERAAGCFREALRLKPNHHAARLHLGNCVHLEGKLDEAEACFRALIGVKDQPDPWLAPFNLGNVLHAKGHIGEALNWFREAQRIKPDYAAAYSNLLYGMYFDPASSAEQILAEHRRWNQLLAEPLVRRVEPHLVEKRSDRRLKVGYVSAHFREHPVGRFIVPLLAAHDHVAFEVFCYSGVRRADALTERARACASDWRETVNISDAQLAKLIRQDGIDILVDLTMHMEEGRPLMFARKPAPLQVAYLAYCGTTGLSTMDYRISDVYLDPEKSDESNYTEKTVRLRKSYWCYDAPTEAPEPGDVPSARNGFVTFGCLNNFSKVSDATLLCWGRLMRGIPNSRLILNCAEGHLRDRVRQVIGQAGVDAERIEMLTMAPMGAYFARYQRIDIGLDPFPYAGGTTTCDTLWMGVPVVTLRGNTAVGRGGVSILTNVGLPELVANNEEEYVAIAVGLAGDIGKLKALRRTLRGRMRGSPLMDAAGLARDMEVAYREMWRNYYAGANA